MASLPFQSESESDQFWNRLQTPPMPSSAHRYARERACSNGKDAHALPSGL